MVLCGLVFNVGNKGKGAKNKGLKGANVGNKQSKKTSLKSKNNIQKVKLKLTFL